MKPKQLESNQVKAIFFDFGDTLASLVPSREELFIRAAVSIGLQLDLDSIKDAYRIVDFHNKYSSVSITNSQTREAFYKNYNNQLCQAIGISSYFEELYPVLASHFKKQKEWRLLSGAAEVLSRLHQQTIPLALVANWDRDLRVLAERLGIERFFACVISSQEIGREKPDAHMFTVPIDRLSLSTESHCILYVGNEYGSDIVGARAAGLVPVLIDQNNYYPHADCIRFRSLIEWFQALKLE